MRIHSLLLAGCFVASGSARAADLPPPPGFVGLFNGTSLAGWKADAGAARWSVKNGKLASEGPATDLWTERPYGNFLLQLEWRWSGQPVPAALPLLTADGLDAKDPAGQPVLRRVPDAGAAAVLLRGSVKARVSLSCRPCGSGEVSGYRADPATPAAARRLMVPAKAVDRPIGEWNKVSILVSGDHLSVMVNGEKVITHAPLAGVPASGAIGLQAERGSVEFRNVYVREIVTPAAFRAAPPTIRPPAETTKPQ